MGIQVGFMLADLQAAAAKDGAKVDVSLDMVPGRHETLLDCETGEYYTQYIPPVRDDRVTVTMPDGRTFGFNQSFDTPEGVRFWFSNKNVNHELRDVLDELKVPYDRG
jgi:hypothetical protein